MYERVHIGEKPYECKQCGKGVSEAGKLRVHLRGHTGGTGEKPYERKQCGNCFSQAAHLRVHIGRKAYKVLQLGFVSMWLLYSLKVFLILYWAFLRLLKYFPHWVLC